MSQVNRAHESEGRFGKDLGQPKDENLFFSSPKQSELALHKLHAGYGNSDFCKHGGAAASWKYIVQIQYLLKSKENTKKDPKNLRYFDIHYSVVFILLCGYRLFLNMNGY